MKLFRIGLLSVVLLTIIRYSTHAQETIEQTDNTYYAGITQKYHVLKSNENIRQGLYQGFYKRKTVIASGNYVNGKKAGVWHFYDINGKPIQHFDYDKNQLFFVANEDTSGNIVRNNFLKKLSDTDSLFAPIRVGGILYGYLPYIKKFKVQDMYLSDGLLYGVLQILVSPKGRLAECKLLVKNKMSIHGAIEENVMDTYVLNTDLLNDDDKIFVPATVNHEQVSSIIYVYCNIRPNGLLSIY